MIPATDTIFGGGIRWCAKYDRFEPYCSNDRLVNSISVEVLCCIHVLFRGKNWTILYFVVNTEREIVATDCTNY